ncbi:protein ABHD16A-like [Centruroides sculpturatus]|uniref:protein ABHD16A-like n=1 Tax=Centruroides sculpturatus TaxID=218467 RepID=UPI000C6C8E7C|nr:protein ABHD16A-like [Centruroides sculpturatus]
MAIGSFARCVFSPRLYRIYKHGDERGSMYNANIVEAYSDTVVKSISVAWSVIIYTCPFIITILYKRGFYSVDGIFTLGRFAGYLSLLLLSSLCLRGIGRCSNCNYMNFLSVLERSQKSLTKENKAALSRFDFDFFAWPVEFAWNSTQK